MARHFPALAAIVGTPEAALIRSFDERVDPLRVAGRYGEPDAAQRGAGQPLPDEMRPRGTAVAGDVDAAPRSSILTEPRINPELPSRSEDDARVGRIYGHVDGSGVIVNEQNALPALPAVARPKYPAFLL